MTGSNEMLRVTYYQEIMPEEGLNADFTIEPELITSKSDGIPAAAIWPARCRGVLRLIFPRLIAGEDCYAALPWIMKLKTCGAVPTRLPRSLSSI